MSSVLSEAHRDSDGNNTPLPSYLARHLDLGYDSDDVSALITSIDSSQLPQTSPSSQLPAELLLEVLEYVPIDYILDWRLVCRGFRDAIDGRVLFHHLHRTELIGYMGPWHSRPLERLDEEEYDQIHLLHARFLHLEQPANTYKDNSRAGPVWADTYAVFAINDSWYQAFRHIGGAEARNGDTVEDADAMWLNTLDRLELRRADEGFGTLRWCIRLDHAVLDMDFPLEAGRNQFGVQVRLHEKTIKVAWKNMLFNLLKTETSLRCMLEDVRTKTNTNSALPNPVTQKQNTSYSFSHFEDCLRATRRQRLLSALDPDNKVDRHIKWSLRLLHPLFNFPRHDHHIPLEDVENDATRLLLLLRREAIMTPAQRAHLQQLARDYRTMNEDVSELEHVFSDFKEHLSLSGSRMSVSLPLLDTCNVPRNALAWSDDLRANIEDVVGNWRSQKKVLEQLKALLTASNLALEVPEDTFDHTDSDF